MFQHELWRTPYQRKCLETVKGLSGPVGKTVLQSQCVDVEDFDSVVRSSAG